MSENINFIPANELPVAEGDEVSVLCVEGGELKQKPGASLGGSSALYIHGTEVIDSDTGLGTVSFSLVPTGTFETLKSNLLKGTPVTVGMVIQVKEITSDGEVEVGAMATPIIYGWMVGRADTPFPDGAIQLIAEFGTFFLLPDDSIMVEGELTVETGAD